MLFALLVGELHHQDAVLGDEPDQRDEADLRVDIERGEAEIERHQRAEDRERHREHDDERIAKALELRGEHQVDDDDGEAEGDERRVALLHLQPRLADEILEEAGRHHLRRDLAQAASASPVATPGSGKPEIVAEFSWLNCSTATGAACVSTVITAESGTIVPLALRT